MKYIVKHPLNRKRKVNALSSFLKWQIGVRLNPYSIIFPFAEKTKLIISRGMTGATGNLYCGLDEFEDMAFVLHFLREDDLFIDIGANIGSYTLLAASEVGAETISIEPIPENYTKLNSNIKLNDLSGKVKSLNIGVGSANGILKFTKSLDKVNHVATDKETDTINVPIEKFDDIIAIQKTTLIKIDVEGFETEVLNGMEIALANPNLIGIVIELNGSGERYNFDEILIKKKLVAFGFEPYFYNPYIKELIKERYTGYCSENIIFLKNIYLVKNRLKNSKCFKIEGQLI